jgi:hypothetical protein
VLSVRPANEAFWVIVSLTYCNARRNISYRLCLFTSLEFLLGIIKKKLC